MKAFLKPFIAAIITLPFFSIVSIAQPPGDAAFKKVKLLKQRLELTDQQADSIYTVLKKHNYQQCNDIASFTKKSECYKRVHSSKQADMKSVLTEAQKTQLDEFIIECQENHGPAKKTKVKRSSEKISCSS